MRSLLARLLVVVTIAVVPALGFQAYIESQAHRVRERLIEDEAMRLVRLVNAEQQRIVDGAGQVLNVLAAAPGVQDRTPDSCHRLLAGLVEHSPRYLGGAVFGLDGHLVCTSNTFFNPSLDVSDRDYFQQAVQTGDVAIGGYTTGRSSKQPALLIARPFRAADGSVAGVVAVSLSLEWLNMDLAQLPLPPWVNASILDRNGIFLARRPNAHTYVGQPLRPELRFMLEGKEPRVVPTTSLEGSRVLVGYVPPGADPIRLFTAVGVDRDVAFASVARADRRGLLLIAGSALLALLVTILAGSRLIRRPFAAMVAVADRWRSGDLAARSGMAGNRSEFGRLAASLDAMAAAHEAREQALRRLTSELDARVRQEVGAREAAQARAAQAERMQALGLLAGGIAHDFNNVLQMIMGAVSLIERRAGDAAGVRRFARMAIEAAERGSAITRRLLAFGRRGDLRAEPLDPVALLNGLLEVFAHTLGAVITVGTELEGGLPALLADRAQLETVLVNLASNARDAMPDGGRLTLSAAAELVPEEGPAHPAGLAPGRYVRLTVADNGIGMDAATVSRATEPFFTTKGHGHGTGLGLAMAKGFAEQSGGALSIDSRLGSGTTVTLWMPTAVSGEPVDGAAPNVSGAAVEPGSMRPAVIARVLVVDDEVLVRDTLVEQLQDAGFGALAAASGTEALALLASGEAVDVLITDLSMPEMDGIALIRAAQARCPGLPVVLLTGYAGDTTALAVDGAFSGSFSLLRKPVGADQLVARVRALLAGAMEVGR